MSALLSTLVVVCLSAWQIASQPVDVRGEIQGVPEGTRELRIELAGLGGAAFHSSWTGPNGQFDFSRVEPGNYTLRVLNLRGETIRTDQVSVSPSQNFLRIQIQGRQVRRFAAGTVSAARLLRDPSGKSVEDFQQARYFLALGDRKRALKHLSQSLKHDPDYPEAHIAMGMLAARDEHWDDAAAAFERAAKADSRAFQAWEMLALARIHLSQFQGAEAAARRVTSAHPNNLMAQHLLGLALCGQGRFGEETLACFRRASQEIPPAKEALNQLLAARQRRPD